MHLMALRVHIVAGALGIIFGFVALFVAKGGRLHRRSGMGFVYAMLAMGLLGALMAAIWGRQPASNIPVGLLTAYLVMTALITVRPPVVAARGWDLGLMLLAGVLALTLFRFGLVAAGSAKGELAGIPAPPFFIFGTIALLSGAGDLRMIRAGGAAALRGVPRLTRHLWRMCLALLIAAFSFFVGQAKVIPRPIRIMPLLLVPPLVVLAALLYWLWRMRLRRRSRGVSAVAGTTS